MAEVLDRFNSFWFGDRLGYIEQLTLLSARALGHHFTLYSYRPEALRGIPPGVEIRDANEIVPEQKLIRFFGGNFAALGSDFFRYALMAKDLGYWVDLDVCFLKRFDFDDEYVFGWQRPRSINNAILRLPARSPIVTELCEFPKANWLPPFFGPGRTLLYYWTRLMKGDVNPEDLAWGTFGPLLLTYLAKKHNLEERAQERSVFYPVRLADARALFGPASVVEKMLTPQTRAVHLWRARMADFAKAPPPAGSYIEVLCRQHGIDVRAKS